MEDMGYPTPPLSSGRHSPKTSSLPPYSSQITRTTQGRIQENAYFSTYERPSSPSYTKPYYPSSPSHTCRTPRSRSGSPILYRIPSPYSASRPKPRKGFVKRVLGKFRQWIREILRFARRNPIKAGLMSVLPIVAVGGLVKGLVKAGKGLVSFLGEDGRKAKSGENERESRDPSDFSIFDQFTKFGGSKAGPLDGILKILQMLVNQYSKLTTSNVPKVASIIFELYFLEPWKL